MLIKFLSQTLRFLLPFGGRIQSHIFNLIAGMLHANYPLADSLDSLSENSTSNKRWLKKIAQRVREGAPLSEAIQQDKEFVPPILISLTNVGENFNYLPETFSLACQLNQKEPSQTKAIKAYTIFILSFFVIWFSVMSIFVIPVYQEMYGSLGKKSPLLTQKILYLSDVLTTHLPYILFLSILVYYFLKRIANALKRREFFFRILQPIPILGRGVFYLRWWRVLYGLGGLLKIGIPIDEAIRAVGEGLQRPALVKLSSQVKAHLHHGKDPIEALIAEKSVPSQIKFFFSSYGAVLELADILLKSGETFHKIGRIAQQRLTVMAKEIILLIICSVIGLVTIALYLPLLQMAHM